ncbi:MAG: 4-hydroxy-tetrahydrodipicolinate reductase [Campylobacterota bacterium]
MKKVGVFGATGRVGRRIVDLLQEDEDLSIGSIFVRNELDFSVPGSALVTNDITTMMESCDVVIDFSLPEATEKMLEVAIEKVHKPLVIATTGLNQHQKNLLQEAANKMPVLYATNMSLGISLLKHLVEDVAKKLPDFDIEITEMHHRHKVDAPSGTALTLAEHAAKGRDLDLDDVRVSGRSGHIGERSKHEIAVMSLRGGDIVGKHTVGFYNDGEFIELGHTATSRDTFAKGAITVAKWIQDKPAGLYNMNDCLGI